MSKNDVESLLLENVYTSEKFAVDIETLVVKQNLGYIEAIAEFCEVNGIAVEEVPKLISGKLKKNIEQQALEKRLLKGRETSTKLV